MSYSKGTYRRNRIRRYAPDTGYHLGQNRVVCMRCDFVFLSSQIVRDGYNKNLLVCKGCYDPAHPQDNLRSFPENLTPAVSNPEILGVSVPVAIPGIFTAGTASPGEPSVPGYPAGLPGGIYTFGALP